MNETMIKVTVNVERRPDGGVRIYSEDVPELVLSGSDVSAVFADMKAAIETILSHKLGCSVEMHRLMGVKDFEARGETNGIDAYISDTSREYAVQCV